MRKIRNFLRVSKRLHLRDAAVSNASDLVDLIDRFLEDKLRYELEWDDFISWPSLNPTIEASRNKIAALEPEFFSSGHESREKAVSSLIEERNRLAALCGLEKMLPR